MVLNQFKNLSSEPDCKQVALDRKGPLAAAVAEAVRLRSPGVDLRMAAADLFSPIADGRQLSVKKASSHVQTFMHIILKRSPA